MARGLLFPAGMTDVAPIITGQLRAFPIGDVLQFLGSSRVTGTLSVTFRDRRAFLLLEDGWIVGASPARTKKGPRLVYRETTEADLMARVCEVITRAMTWPKGQFAFTVSSEAFDPPADDEEKPRLLPQRVVMETALAIDQERRVG
jgi:hypothetical protein